MMMRGRPIIPFLGSLFLIALVIGVSLLAYNAGAAQGTLFGAAVAPVVAGLFAVLLALIVLRLAAKLVLLPLFGFGFMRMRRHGWGRHGWKHGWRDGWGRKYSREDWQEGVPPMVAEWHRRMHQEAAGDAEPANDTV